MELKYIILTIIKILISVPAILLIAPLAIDGAALMGGHLDNKSTSNLTSSYFDFDLNNDQELPTNKSNSHKTIHKSPQNQEQTEEIPNPSPLVVPGYNLPESIFNKGKPFYLEKDPLTGAVDFENRTPNLKIYDDEYEYMDEDSRSDLYDKANINRKDGGLSSHKINDVNQLTPNLYDFLNLPVKYNSDKYVYPLISSSYANTKIQGNVNKYHNHKEYAVTTYKPTKTPTYFSTKSAYFNYKTTEKPTIATTTTTTLRPKTTSKIYLTTNEINLMDSAMNHPSFDDQYEVTQKSKIDEIYLTSTAATTSTTTATSTERILSLLEQFMASFDEPAVITSTTTTASITTASTQKAKPAGVDNSMNILTGSNMEHQSAYDYDYEENATDNIAVENVQVIMQNVSQYAPVKASNSDQISTQLKSNATAIPSEYDDYIDDTTIKSLTSSSTSPFTSFEFSTPSFSIAQFATSPKVTSLPLGENHVTYNNNPIIVATQNLREQLNNEKVIPKPFGPNKLHPVPSTSNIHIGPDQDTVSFVVGNHQNVDGQYIGTALKESPYDSNPFRPLYGQGDQKLYDQTEQKLYSQVGQKLYSQSDQNLYDQGDQKLYGQGDQKLYGLGDQKLYDQGDQKLYGQGDQKLYGQGDQNLYEQKLTNTVSYTIQSTPVQSSMKIQPIRNSETSLSIGVPIDMVKGKPGQVVDETLEINNEKIKFPKGGGSKIVFPDEKTTYQPDLFPPQPPPKTYMPLLMASLDKQVSQPNREVLKLNSQPMFHQLPSDLTPPSENRISPTVHVNRDRPPWDPRPGHFHAGRPEYARPPRPNQNDAFKRVDILPNILPQFRPNIKLNKGYLRQPLLDRPSNRPIGFFEKLHPPPPPPAKLPPLPPHQLLHNMRNKEPEVNFRQNVAEDRIMNEGYKKSEQFFFYQTPPKVVLPTRRNGEEEIEVETLQMIQAKQDKDKSKFESTSSSFQTSMNGKDSIEKPIYVVYPVNTPPLKLDVIDTNKKEAVVIGTRAELPLPPSKIKQEGEDDLDDFVYDTKLEVKPQQTDYKQPNPQFDFQQNQRHDSPVLKPHHRPNYQIKSEFPYPLEIPDPALLNPVSIETTGNDLDNQKFPSGTNQWNSLVESESRIVSNSKINTQANQISVKLKTYTEKPIAVAYTPTESHESDGYSDRFSMPNYASPVIPEIRPESTGNAVTLPQQPDKIIETTHVPQLDFQAPFQASFNIDNVSHGWSVIKDKPKVGDDKDETTTLSMLTTSEFDIENFKPQLIGGFKPIYNFPADDVGREMEVKERQE